MEGCQNRYRDINASENYMTRTGSGEWRGCGGCGCDKVSSEESAYHGSTFADASEKTCHWHQNFVECDLHVGRYTGLHDKLYTSYTRPVRITDETGLTP